MPDETGTSPVDPDLRSLDRALADLATGTLGLDSTTPAQLHAKLVNGLWWRVCAAAVTQCPDRLVDWFHGADEHIANVLGDQSDRDDETVLDTARAIAAVGVVLAGACGALPIEDARLAARWAVGYWPTANVLPWSAPAAGTCTDLPAEVRDALEVIGALPDGVARSYVVVLAASMASATTALSRRCQIRVLFDSIGTGQGGLTGVLELAVLPGGPPGLYPNPRTMAFLRADRQFAAALTFAWASAIGSCTTPPCVVWSIAHEVDGIPPVNGDSLGAAFAVALTELVDQRARGYRGFWPLRAFNSARAITGSVTANGEIGPVGGLDRKLRAAHRMNWNVVAPLANDMADGHGVPAGLRVYWVRHVREARARMTGWIRWRVAVAIWVVLVLLVGGTVALRVTEQLTTAHTDESVAQRDAKVQQLLGDADNERGSQPILSLRQALAADALQDSPHDAAQARAELVETLTSLTNSRPHHALISGVGSVRTVAIGQNGLALTVSNGGGVELWNASDINKPVERSALDEAGELIENAAITADDHVAVVSTTDGATDSTLDLWNITNPAIPARTLSFKLPCPATKIAVATDRPIVLAGCDNGTVTLWGFAANPAPGLIGDLASPINGLDAVALDRSGTVAVVGSANGVHVWDISTPTDPRDITARYLQGPNIEPYSAPNRVRPAYSVATTDLGAHVLVGEDTMTAEMAVRVGPDGTGPSFASSLAMQGESGNVVAAGIDADGQSAITTGQGDSAIVWHADPTAESGYAPFTILTQHTDTVISAALSPDGKTAITGSADGSAILWDLSEPSPYSRSAILSQISSNVTTIACSHATTLCVTVTANGYATEWDVSDPAAPQRISGLTNDGQPVRSASFAPNGTMVVLGTSDGMYLWDVSSPNRPIPLTHLDQGGGPIDAAVFSVDGQTVLSGGTAGSVVMWSIADMANPTRIGAWNPGQGSVNEIAVDHLGKTVAVAGDSSAVSLLDISDPGRPRVVGKLASQAGKVSGLAFSPVAPDLLESNAGQLSALLWDVSDPTNPTQVGSLTGHSQTVNSVQYNKTGTMAVTTSVDATSIIWNVTEPSHPTAMATLTGHVGSVLVAAFSPDGNTVLSSAADEQPIVWDITKLVAITADPRQQACQVAGGAFDRQAWNHWVSGFPYADNC